MSISNFNYIVNYESGFKKYIINTINDDNIYFKVINPTKRKSNYMIRYHYHYHNYYDSKIFDSSYNINNNVEKNYTDKNNDNITLSLTFDPIQLIYQNKPYFYDRDITFYISGLLYKKMRVQKN